MEDALRLICYVRESDLAELADVTRNPKKAPYQVCWDGDMAWICGHPTLIASRAEDVIVETDPETEVETISWTMPTLY